MVRLIYKNDKLCTLLLLTNGLAITELNLDTNLGGSLMYSIFYFILLNYNLF